MLRIAVISDTHNRLPSSVIPRLAAVEAIWHLGDVCAPDTLEPLRLLGRPLLVVRGNNDFHEEWPLEKRLQFGTKRFLLTHIPPRRVQEAEVVLCGHTHVPLQEEKDGVMWLNPGTLGLPNKGAPASWALLDLDSATGEFTFTLQPVNPGRCAATERQRRQGSSPNL